MTVNIVQDSEQVLAGAFLARAAYGGEYIDQDFNLPDDDDAEKADDYRGYLASQSGGSWQLLDQSDLPGFDGRGGDAKFTSGGLYNARVYAGFDNTFDAQGLLAVEGGDTLVLAFRGTDGKDPAIEDGQAFTGNGLGANYEAFEPLIDAAYDYLLAHPEITGIVVSGHSLGGALADVFTLKDADRFRALRPEGLTIVSMASSGIPEDLSQHLNGIDAAAATITDGLITNLQRPADYVAIVNSEDRAHFPNDFDGISEADGLAPIFPLTGNLQFGGDIVFDVPNIENGDVLYHDPLDHPFDYRGMGAEHNSALLWTNLQGLMSDGLFSNYAGQHLIAGITDYNAVADVDGTAIALFEGYLELNNPNFINDRGYRSLFGTAGADYILGLAGADRLDGRTGFDLLSGGLGDDVILGGKGGDKIFGGLGKDDLSGGEGRDRFVFRDILESAVGNARDFIRDFNTLEGDRINLTGLDAKASTTGDDAFTFIGEAAFSAEGQIRIIQSGSDTIIRLNLSGAGGADMDILVRNFAAATFDAEDFIL